MKRRISFILFLVFLSGSISLGQTKKPVRTISLDQLLGKKSSSTVSQKADTPLPAPSVKGTSEHIGAIGSVLERIDLKGGSLTQDQISIPFRRYVVNGTLDLGGKTITMPDGCILDLEKGSLKNGSLKMNTTLVTPIYGISKERNISKVKVSGEYYETLVDLWGEQTEPLFPWDTTAPQKVYLVDLKKFGITPGYQKRGSDGHYSDRQYDLMYNNGVGFTNAIQWAYKNGYDGIRFPKNQYCFTPRTTKSENPTSGPIVLVENLEKFDIDFGGATCYLILDSKKKSKYYTVSPEKPYSQGSTMFFVACCINLQIHNGTMVGDRKLRDYDTGAEQSVENTTAINVSSYCQNIHIHHLDLSDFMADGISCAQFGNWFSDYESRLFNPKMTWPGQFFPGHYVNQRGLIKKDTENKDFCTISNYLSLTKHYHKDVDIIRKIASKRRYSVNNNLGYTRLINNYHNVEILTFNERISTEIPLRIIKTSYLESFELSSDETGVRIQSYYDEGATNGGFQHSCTITDVVSSNCIIDHCYIHDNHRGGISGGCNYVAIRDCKFSKNHTDKNYRGKVIPIFTVGATNYHINFEDSYAKGLEVSSNSFNRTSSSVGRLLFGVLTLSFHDNVSDSGVVIYNNLISDIYNNNFQSVGIGLAPWRHSTNNDILHDYGFVYQTRLILFHGNTIGQEAKLQPHYRTEVWQWGNSIKSH